MSTSTIGVRLTIDDRKLLDKVCRARGEDLSDFVRRSIRKELAHLNYLTDDEKKALGIPPQEKTPKHSFVLDEEEVTT